MKDIYNDTYTRYSTQNNCLILKCKSRTQILYLSKSNDAAWENNTALPVVI